MKRKRAAADGAAARAVPERGLWLTAAAVAEAGVVALALAIEAAVFKRLELGQIGEQIGVADVARAAAPDVALAAGLWIALAAALSIRAPLARIPLAALAYLAAVAALVLNAASFGYFAATGSHLSLASLEVWGGHMGETNAVIAGEAMTWKLPLVVAQAALAPVVAALFRLGPIRRRLAARGGFGRKGTVAALVVAAVVIGGALAMPKLEGPRMGLCRSIPLSILAEALAAAPAPGAEGAPTEEERPTDLVFAAEPGAPRPNIVFIMYESLNWKSSDVYVPGRGTTPFLAELAKTSAVVERQYTVVPHTSKAIVSILCGITPYPGSKRIESVPGILPKQCMAHILRGQGYRTAYFQPATDFEERSQLVKNMGFETFRGLGDLKAPGFEKTSYFGREDKIMLAPSLDWVDSVKDDGPFFLAYMTLASHHNYVTPQSFPRATYPETDPDQQNYLNAIRYLDDFVREVYAGFAARGLLEDTVFIIVGDHGEAFAEHARRQHDLIMWEEGLRCAALLHGPKHVPPGRIEGIRSHLDLVPTVVDLLGLTPQNGSFEGTSLLAPPREDRKLFHSCWFNNQCAAVQEGGIKTIYHFESQPMEVYNTLVDEREADDLAGRDLYGEAFLSSRKKEILEWKAGVERRYRDWEKGLAVGRVLKAPPPIAHRIRARFGDSIELVGYDVRPARIAGGGDLKARYVFKCLRTPPPGTELFVHLLRDKGGHLNADHDPVGGAHPVRRWQPGEYIVDEHSIHVPTDWAGGTARLAIGFWNDRSEKRLPVIGEGLSISDGRLVVAEIEVGGGGRPAALDEAAVRAKIADWVGPQRPEIGQAVGAVFGGAIELVGVTLRRADVKLAGTVEADYVFRSIAQVPDNWRLVVALVREEDGRSIKGDHDPLGGLYPPGKWRPGEYVVDRHSIHIDMYKSKVGRYGLWLGFEVGGHPVRPTGDVRTDDRGRVYLGAVTINPRSERQ